MGNPSTRQYMDRGGSELPQERVLTASEFADHVRARQEDGGYDNVQDVDRYAAWRAASPHALNDSHIDNIMVVPDKPDGRSAHERAIDAYYRKARIMRQGE